MPKPSAPAHPGGEKSRLAAWLWDKEEAELCKERPMGGCPIRHRLHSGAGAGRCHQLVTPALGTVAHRAPFSSAVLGGG